MNHTWNIEGTKPEEGLSFKMEEIILAYDGPQVITARDQYGNRYIAVAVDDSDDGEIVRWLYAEISDLEFVALVSGGTTLREALDVDTVFVVDVRTNGGTIEQIFRTSGLDVPPRSLPRKGAALPASVQRRFAIDRPAKPSMRVSGKAVLEHKIPFVDIGNACVRKQDLWDALYVRAYLGPRRTSAVRATGHELNLSTMMMANIGPGSVAVTIEPVNETIFNRISDDYKKLVEIGADEAAIRNAFGADVLRAYSEYMAFLDGRKMEVLTTSSRTVSYVGPKKSARVVGSLTRRRVRPEAPAVETEDTQTVKVIGHFEGYSYVQKSFDFVADALKQTFSGTVEEGVLTRNPIERGLVLSRQTLYEAEIKISRKGERVTHHLLGFWQPDPPKVPPQTPTVAH